MSIKKKRLFGILFSLAMAMGLMLAMSATAWATDDPHSHGDILFQQWTDALAEAQNGEGKTAANSLPGKPGNYYLANDVQLTGTWNVPEDSVVNLCLNGKSISEGNEKNFSAIKIPENAVLNLYDEEGNTGKITGVTYASYAPAGVVYVLGTFKMYGGQITGNTVRVGTVYVENGDFTLEGGAITKNKVNDYAAGVYLSGLDGKFTMNGGSISDNSTIEGNKNGGGVYQNSGTFTMNGGTIANNTCTGDGGGVYQDSGTFNLNGGAITGNKAVKTGGIYSGSTFNLAGDPTIKDNLGGCTITEGELTGGSASNVFLPYSDSLINIEGPLTNTDAIGVSKGSTGVGVFTKSAEGVKASEYEKKFTSENSDSNLVIKTEGDELKIAQSKEVAYLDADGKKTIDTYATMYDVGTDDFLSGWYVVDKGRTLSNVLYAYDELNLILCDDVTLKLDKGLHALKANKVKLNIYAQSTGEHAGKLIAAGPDNTAGIGGRLYNQAGTINIYGGTITAKGGKNAAGIGSGSSSNGGIVNVYGGEIIAEGGDNAAGIGAGNGSSSYNGGKFTMNGGTVTAKGGNNAAGIGGGRKCEGGIIRINGGTIQATAGVHTETSTEEEAVAIGAGAGNNDHGMVILGKNITALAGDDEASATDVTSTFADKHDQKWVKTSARKPISATVTFKVANGSWDEGEGEAATADKTVELKGYEGDTLKLTVDQIPEAGSKPAEGYKAGSWDTEPSAKTSITEDTTYTYTYAQRDAADEMKDLLNAIPAEPTTTEGRKAVTAARKAYENLTDDQKDEIKASELKKLTDAEAAIEQADLTTAKNTAKNDLNTYRKAKADSDYDAEGKAALDAAKANGDKAIDAATNREAVMTALDNAKAAIDAVKTKTSSDDKIAVGKVYSVPSRVCKYVVTSANTVSLIKAPNRNKYTINATVKIKGKTFKVTGINARAFKGTRVKTLYVKTKKLTKKSVKNSLKGSKIKKIRVKVGKKKVNKKYVKKYKKIFTKKNAGKKVKVTR